MDDAILEDSDNSIVTNAVHTSGSNSQALAAILSQYTFQLNRMSTHQKKESPLGAAIIVAVDTTPWRSFECREDCLFGKLFHRGPIKTFHGGKYLHDVIQAQSSFLYLPKGLESICRVTGTEEKKGKAFDSMNLQMNE